MSLFYNVRFATSPPRLLLYPLAALLQSGANHPECLCPVLSAIKHGQKISPGLCRGSQGKGNLAFGEPFL